MGLLGDWGGVWKLLYGYVVGSERCVSLGEWHGVDGGVDIGWSMLMVWVVLECVGMRVAGVAMGCVVFVDAALLVCSCFLQG